MPRILDGAAIAAVIKQEANRVPPFVIRPLVSAPYSRPLDPLIVTHELIQINFLCVIWGAAVYTAGQHAEPCFRRRRRPRRAFPPPAPRARRLAHRDPVRGLHHAARRRDRARQPHPARPLLFGLNERLVRTATARLAQEGWLGPGASAREANIGCRTTAASVSRRRPSAFTASRPMKVRVGGP